MNKNPSRARKSSPKNVKALTPEELSEYEVRHGRVRAAQLDLLLIDESFRTFLRTLGAKYEVGTRFEINTKTGEIKVAATEPPDSDGVPDNLVVLEKSN